MVRLYDEILMSPESHLDGIIDRRFGAAHEVTLTREQYRLMIVKMAETQLEYSDKNVKRAIVYTAIITTIVVSIIIRVFGS